MRRANWFAVEGRPAALDTGRGAVAVALIALFWAAACDGGQPPVALGNTPPASTGEDAGTKRDAPGKKVDAPAGGEDAEDPPPEGDGPSAPPEGDAGVVEGPARTIVALDRVRIGSRSASPNLRHAIGALDPGAGPFASATLVVDLDSTCYPFSRWSEDPPPAGQRWPASCDAFDRLFEIVLDPPTGPEGRPGIELIRAATPFGGPLHLEVDVTDVLNGARGAHRLEAHIDTWSDAAGQVTGSSGGWTVSAKVVAKPGKPPREVLAVVPLYHDSQKLTGSQPFAFTVPAGTTRSRIEYRATGHTAGASTTTAGCNGPPDEFCQRTFTFAVDDKPAGMLVPYRTNCTALCTIVRDMPMSPKSYCKENPCGAVASVRASRANWCPGSMTPPHVLEPALAPGPHAFKWALSAIGEGGMWRISAVYIAYK